MLNKKNGERVFGVFKRFVFVVMFLFLPFVCMGAADQETEDIFASVIVLPSFEIGVDNNFLDFGLVEPGKSVTLKPATYYNTLRCVSNKGNPYYVRMHVLDGINGPDESTIPVSNFKWKIYDIEGSGTAQSEWREFSDKPVDIYVSGAEDETGDAVLIYLQYKLDLPASAMGGHYSLNVIYTLTEEQ